MKKNARGDGSEGRSEGSDRQLGKWREYETDAKTKTKHNIFEVA